MTATLEGLAPFQNQPIKNFTDDGDRAAMSAALASVKGRFGRHYPLVIDGKRIETEKRIQSVNPADPSQAVGETSSASKEQALEAIMRRAVFFSTEKPLYDQIRYLDENGQEVFRINHGGHVVPTAELQSKATRTYFKQANALPAGAVFISTFDLNIEGAGPTKGMIVDWQTEPIKGKQYFMPPPRSNSGSI